MSFKFRAEERQNAPTVKVFISSTLLVWSSHEESVSQCRLMTIRALFIHFFNKSFLENRMCRFLLSVEDTDLSTVLVFRHRCLLFQLQAGADRTTAGASNGSQRVRPHLLPRAGRGERSPGTNRASEGAGPGGPALFRAGSRGPYECPALAQVSRQPRAFSVERRCYDEMIWRSANRKSWHIGPRIRASQNQGVPLALLHIRWFYTGFLD